MKARTRAKWVIASAVAVIGVVFLCLGLPSLEQARGPARETQCRNNLKLIELALWNYHDTHGSFPPAVVYGPDGKAWHSWRVLLLPFLEQANFYERYRFDEPWNGPHNRELEDKFSPGTLYFCPADDEAWESRATSYLAVVGDGTMWPPDGSSLSLDDVTDDQKATIHVVEVADSGIHWMEPIDLRLDAMTFSVNAAEGQGIRSHHRATTHTILPDEPPKANAAFVGTTVRPLDASTPAQDVRSMLLRNDGGP